MERVIWILCSSASIGVRLFDECVKLCVCEYHIVKHGYLDYRKVSKSYFFIGVIRLDDPFKVKKLSYSNNF